MVMMPVMMVVVDVGGDGDISSVRGDNDVVVVVVVVVVVDIVVVVIV